MRRRLFLGLALAAVLIAIGATWAGTFRAPDVSQPVGTVTTVTVIPSDSDAKPSCCRAGAVGSTSAELLYCTLTDTVGTECCCVVVDGKWVCLLTGTVSDECCCVRLANAK